MFDDVSEYYFNCPYCFSEISMLLDPSVAEQEYVEDCEVCCNPIAISFTIDVEANAVINFEATRLD